MSTQTERLFNRPFTQLFLIQLLSMVTFYSLFVAISPYAVATYHVSTATAGSVAGMTIIGTMIARIFSGLITQHLTAKQMTILSMAILLPSLLAYQLELGIGYLLFVRFWQGIAVGFTGTVTNTAVVRVIPEARRSEGIAYFSLATILGTAFGPFLALLITQYVSYHILFWLEAVIALIALFFSFMLDGDKIAIDRGHVDAKTSIFSQLLEPRVFPIALTMAFVALGYAALQGDLAFFACSLHLVTFASYFFLVYAFVILLSRPFMGRLMDQHNENFVIYPTLLATALGLFAIARMHSGWGMLLGAVLVGLGFGNFQSAIQATVTKVVASDRLAQATSTYFIFFDMALGFGPYLLGLVVPTLGYRGLFTMVALFAIIGLPLYYLVHGRHIQK